MQIDKKREEKAMGSGGRENITEPSRELQKKKKA